MSVVSLAAWVASTSALNAPVTPSASSVKPMSGAGESSRSGGLESLATPMYEAFNWQTGGDFRLGMGDMPTALQKEQVPAVLISYVEVSPAKTSVSLDAEPD